MHAFPDRVFHRRSGLCRPEHAGKSVGAALLAALEEHAVRNGVRELQLDSSLNAVAFYERAGYSAVAQAVHELGSGVSIPGVTMRKSLASTW